MPGSGGTHRYSAPSPLEINPAGQLSGLRELNTPSVIKTSEAALCGVRSPTRLASAVTSANDIRAAKATPPPPVLRVPLTDLLGRRSVLLALATASASTTTTAAATSSTTPTSAAAASTATPSTTSAPATSPAAAATTATATATTSPTTASPAVSATSLAPFALAAAVPARSRRSPDLLSTKEVYSSSRGDRGKKGGRRAPLKERGTGVTTRGTYSDYASLSCKEFLLEEGNGELSGAAS
ncbi:unnamed protein product [Closterium sp. NIES-53]